MLFYRVKVRVLLLVGSIIVKPLYTTEHRQYHYERVFCEFNTISIVVKGSKYLKSELAFLKIYKYTTKSENVYDDGRVS